MRGLIINHHRPYIGVSKLSEMFSDCDIMLYNEFDYNFVNSYDYFILSGGDINISGINDIIEEKEFIKNTQKPILGICLGLQIISICNGQNLLEFEKRRTHIDSFNLFDEKIDIQLNHGCYIPQLPVGFDGIIDENHVKALWNKNILAVQGHPELSSSLEYIKKLFYSRF